MTASPLILSIKGNSLDDGPGIRSVVFFKGCPLRCAWCHNPESASPSAELGFEEGECIRCDECFEVCPEGALNYATDGLIDRTNCTLCFDCVEACPAAAFEQVGTLMSVEEVVERVHKDRVFFDRSGGGVTLSGGEPTLFLDYASRLAKRFGELGIHVLLETCGHFDIDRFESLLYPHLDLIYFDLKVFDDTRHRDACGRGNRIIFENFARLYERAHTGGVPVLPRIPLVPGFTSYSENLQPIAEFLASLGASTVALMPYNPMWRVKLDKLGRQDIAETGPTQKALMSEASIAQCRAVFAEFTIVGTGAIPS